MMRKASLVCVFWVLVTFAVTAAGQERYGVLVDGKVGFIDERGKLVIPARFDEERLFDRWGGWVKVGELWGRIDETGKMILPPQYDLPGVFDTVSETAVVRRDGRYGVIDRSGKIRVNFVYDEMHSVVGSPVMVGLSRGKWTLIDRSGKTVLPTSLSEDDVEFNLSGTNGPLLGFRQNDKWGFVDLQRGVLVEARFDDLELWWSQDRFAAEIGGRWGVIDAHGKTIVDFAYDKTEPRSGEIRVEKGGKWAILDPKGRVQPPGWIEKRYVSIAPTLWLDGQDPRNLRLLDGEFKPLGSARYEGYKVWPNEPPLILLKQGGLWGAVNSQGKVTIPFTYQDLDYARNGQLSFKSNGKWGLLDRDGKVIAAPLYDSSIGFIGNFARVYSANRVGLMDAKGHLVIPVEYEGVDVFDELSDWDARKNGTLLAIVQIDGRLGYINRKGDVVWKPSK